MTSRTLRIAYRLRVILAAASENRINHLIKKYPDVPEEHVRRLADADPSDGKYLEWLLRNYQSFVFAHHDPTTDEITTEISSLGSITEMLKFFQKISRSPRTLEIVELDPDINKIKYPDLLLTWYEWRNKDLDSERKKRDRAKQEGAKLIYDEGGYKVIQVGGPGTNAELAPLAACIYGKNTKWCTTGEGVAENYLKRGPLYILIKDGQNVLQTDLSEVKDPEDKHLSLTAHPEYVQVLIDAGLLSDPQKAWDFYKKLGMTQRWPAIEPVLAQDARTAVDYARTTRQRFPLGEEAIAQDVDAAFIYMVSVLQQRFPEAEPTLKKDPEKWKYYVDYVNYLEGPDFVKSR